MSFYDGLASTALRLISDKGRAITLRRVTTGAYSPATDLITGDDEDDEAVRAVVTNFRKHEIDGEIILRTDKKVLLAASGIDAPAKTDLLIDGDQYAIINIETIQPGDTPLLYILQVRK